MRLNLEVLIALDFVAFERSCHEGGPFSELVLVSTVVYMCGYVVPGSGWLYCFRSPY